MIQPLAAFSAVLLVTSLAGCSHAGRQGPRAGAPGSRARSPAAASPQAADSIPPPAPPAEAGPASSAPAAATCASPGAGQAAAKGAVMGAGLVLRIWVTVCIVGGPLTLAVCIIGFPEYWPIAAGAVVLATGIGAAIGGASAGRVPCPAPPPAASASPGLVGPQVQRQGADPG